jgi:hypothetical protein
VVQTLLFTQRADYAPRYPNPDHSTAHLAAVSIAIRNKLENRLRALEGVESVCNLWREIIFIAQVPSRMIRQREKEDVHQGAPGNELNWRLALGEPNQRKRRRPHRAVGRISDSRQASPLFGRWQRGKRMTVD